MKVIGIQHSEFDTRDGKHVSGMFLYLSEVRNNVEGVATERIFLSNAKVGDYPPMIGDEIKVNYNRFGKVDNIEIQ